MGHAFANENYTGCKGVGIHASHAVAKLSAHRPSTASSKPCANHRIKESLPTSTSGACVAVTLRLLKSIVDGDREGWMCLLREAIHCLGHPIEKKCLGPSLTTMAISERISSYLGTQELTTNQGIWPSMNDASIHRRSLTGPHTERCHNKVGQWKQSLKN